MAMQNILMERLGWKEPCRGGGGLVLLRVQGFLRSSGHSVLSHGDGQEAQGDEAAL